MGLWRLVQKSQGGPGTQRRAALLPVQNQLHKRGKYPPQPGFQQYRAVPEIIRGNFRGPDHFFERLPPPSRIAQWGPKYRRAVRGWVMGQGSMANGPGGYLAGKEAAAAFSGQQLLVFGTELDNLRGLIPRRRDGYERPVHGAPCLRGPRNWIIGVRVEKAGSA